MKKVWVHFKRKLAIAILGIAMLGGATQPAIAKTVLPANLFDKSGVKQLVINSNSFNAKKRSSFTITGQTKQIERGLTIIHFHAPDTFEFRTFDTYSSGESCREVIEVLGQMLKNNAIFAILAHDSAANNALKQSEKLSEIGFPQLRALKNRQAYFMHNFTGNIYENTEDTSITTTLNIPEDISDDKIYFPKVTYEFEPSNDRYIAHAGGEVNGIKSTNSKEALDQNYEKGFRLFELDIIETSDGKMVAAHDWKMWARFTDYKGTLPPSHEEFMKHKIYGDYTTLDMEGINHWFNAHPDATLVTDKLNNPIAFANAFVDKKRLIMELFSTMAVEEASKEGIIAMISQKPLLKLKGDKLNYLAVNNVKYVAVSRRILANNTKFMLMLKDQGIKVYVYNVNFDPGKDEKYVQENEIGLVYGMYADKWVFEGDESKKLSK